MANTLDPPIEQVPSQLLENHDMRIYFEELQRWRFDVFVKLGAGGDPISATDSDTNRKADTLLYAVLDKVSLGDPLTSDTTGFTVDSEVLFVDMDES